MKKILTFLSMILIILMMLLPIAASANQIQQYEFTDRPDILVLEIGHSEATDLAIKVISENLVPQGQNDNNSIIFYPTTHYGTISLTNAVLQDKVSFNSVKFGETSLASLKNYLSPYKSALTIIVAHSSANGNGISDGVDSMDFNILIPILSAHTQYTFFASCNSSVVNSLNSHTFGLPGIVDATVAGLVASVWAYNAFGLVNIAQLLFFSLIKNHISLILAPLHPLDILNVLVGMTTPFFLGVSVAMLILLSFYFHLGINGTGAAILSFIVNYLFTNLIWPILTGLPLIGWLISFFDFAKGIFATVISGIVSVVVASFINAVTGDFENVANAYSAILFETIATILTGSLTSPNGVAQGVLFNFLELIFNLGGQIVGTNGLGNYLKAVGAFETIAADVATLNTLKNAMTVFNTEMDSSGLAAILGGTVVGAEVYCISSSLIGILGYLLNLANKNIHITLDINISNFLGIPTGFSVSGSIYFDKLFNDANYYNNFIDYNSNSGSSGGSSGGSGGSGGSGCVAQNTRILLSDGTHFKMVQALKVGDEVMGYNTTSHATMTVTVTKIIETKGVPTLLSINDGLLRVTTTEQPIYMRNSTYTGWISDPQDLKVGDQIFNVITNHWISINQIELINGHFKTYDVATDPLNTFIGNGILLDMPVKN